MVWTLLFVQVLCNAASMRQCLLSLICWFARCQHNASRTTDLEQLLLLQLLLLVGAGRLTRVRYQALRLRQHLSVVALILWSSFPSLVIPSVRGTTAANCEIEVRLVTSRAINLAYAVMLWRRWLAGRGGRESLSMLGILSYTGSSCGSDIAGLREETATPHFLWNSSRFDLVGYTYLIGPILWVWFLDQGSQMLFAFVNMLVSNALLGLPCCMARHGYLRVWFLDVYCLWLFLMSASAVKLWEAGVSLVDLSFIEL